MKNFNKKQLDNTGIVLATGLRISKNNNTLKCFMLFFAVLLYSNATVAQWKGVPADTHRKGTFPPIWLQDKKTLVYDVIPNGPYEIKGYVGIGTYTPKAKLHIKGFDDAGSNPSQDQRDPTLLLEPATWGPGRFATIKFGNNDHLITGKWGEGMTFFDTNGFKFTGGGNISVDGRYVVQNGVDGGPNRGIFMNKADDSNWGIYLGKSGANKALNNDTAVAGGGFSGSAIRFRVPNDATAGFIWENSSNKLLMSLRASDGFFAVEGKIGAREVEVKAGSWADFVFKKNYNLKSLEEVESYIDSNNHLPDVPSEAEVVKNGVAVGEMLKLQMQKIEELTLYLIEQNKRIQALEKENIQLQKQ